MRKLRYMLGALVLLLLAIYGVAGQIMIASFGETPNYSRHRAELNFYTWLAMSLMFLLGAIGLFMKAIKSKE